MDLVEEVAYKIIIEAGNIAKDHFDQVITVEEKHNNTRPRDENNFDSQVLEIQPSIYD